jgi:hypothetical protein
VSGVKLPRQFAHRGHVAVGLLYDEGNLRLFESFLPQLVYDPLFALFVAALGVPEQDADLGLRRGGGQNSKQQESRLDQAKALVAGSLHRGSPSIRAR